MTAVDVGSTEQTELAHDSIGFVDALVIGLNATSPAYSLAAVIGPIVALVGVAAPGVLLASFVPMLLIASAFYYLNKVDQDCGTTFSWVTRAMGPWWGWQGGWAITMTGVLVIGALADVGGPLRPADARPRRPRRRQGRDHDRGGRADRRDDGDLRPRHRALGASPEHPDRRAGAVAARLRRDRDRQGDRRRRDGRRAHAVARAGSTRSRRAGQRSPAACCSASSPTGAGSRRST